MNSGGGGSYVLLGRVRVDRGVQTVDGEHRGWPGRSGRWTAPARSARRGPVAHDRGVERLVGRRHGPGEGDVAVVGLDARHPQAC